MALVGRRKPHEPATTSDLTFRPERGTYSEGSFTPSERHPRSRASYEVISSCEVAFR